MYLKMCDKYRSEHERIFGAPKGKPKPKRKCTIMDMQYVAFDIPDKDQEWIAMRSYTDLLMWSNGVWGRVKDGKMERING